MVKDDGLLAQSTLDAEQIISSTEDPAVGLQAIASATSLLGHQMNSVLRSLPEADQVALEILAIAQLNAYIGSLAVQYQVFSSLFLSFLFLSKGIRETEGVEMCTNSESWIWILRAKPLAQMTFQKGQNNRATHQRSGSRNFVFFFV